MSSILDTTDTIATLRCASCGGTYLHQRRVEIFHRPEDAPRENVGVFLDGEVHGYAERKRDAVGDGVLGKNPSARRSGLSVYFDCENCDKITVLQIAQHKGQTFIDSEVRDVDTFQTGR